MTAGTLREAIQQHGGSGTSVEPPSTPVPMLMTHRGGWMLMLHGNAFAADIQQQAHGERGRDAWTATNWIMPMAQRNFGVEGKGGQLTVRTMLSLEPATVGRRNYPELFQQGETAFGAPIVDGQHPHDFVMELAALYDLPLGKSGLMSLYAAPVGDPAIGPTAYPHRYSASENPMAALGHHQQDSTHIAFNVLTGGFTYKWVRAELSGFHGAEPTEARWHFAPSPNGHAIDSAAGRITVAPNVDWTAQYSVAHIHAPEALYPAEDQQRQTASVMFHHSFRPERAAQPTPSMPGMQHDSMPGMDHANMPGMQHEAMPGMNDTQMSSMDHPPARPAPATPSSQQGSGDEMPGMKMASAPAMDLAITALWGRTRSLRDSSKENSYLAEALLRFRHRNAVWTRIENAGRSSELLLSPGTALPAGFEEKPLGHVAAYSFGYDRDYRLGEHLLVAPGAQITVYRTPQPLRGTYGPSPTAEVLFLRFRLH